MNALRIGIIGAGAAGTAAANRLRQSEDDLAVELLTRTGEQPYNRTLVNKGVALGLLEPEQAALSGTGTQVTADTTRGIDPRTRQVRLDSGDTRTYDALIIASGSRPCTLDESILGRDQAVSSGRLTTLHSLRDARRVRDIVETTRHPARILILGGGLVAAETASLLSQAGHDITLIARSHLPGATAIGEDVARRLRELHRSQHATYLGHSPRAIRTQSDRITIELDDGARIEGDLAIVAHGTTPAAPAPWTGPDGIPVDDHLRLLDAPHQRIYAAGGVAAHHHPDLGTYRIDHWDDAAAEGAHAATALLHDLGLADDPGPYLPNSPFSARIHGRTLAGVGHPGLGTTLHVASTDPLLIVHHHGDTPVAAIGLDAGQLIHRWTPHLHRTPEPTATDHTPGRGTQET